MYNIEPTEMQKKAADNILKQKLKGNVNKGKALLEAGYSKATSLTPSLVINTKGFQQLMEDKLNDTTLIDYLAKDLQLKEGNRLGELKLAFDLKGHTTNKLDVNVRQEVDEQLEEMKRIIDESK